MNSNLCVYFMKLWRTKSADSVTPETSLLRCLGVRDLIVLGIGAMVGSGIYVMTGSAIRNQAGLPLSLHSSTSRVCVFLSISEISPEGSRAILKEVGAILR